MVISRKTERLFRMRLAKPDPGSFAERWNLESQKPTKPDWRLFHPSPIEPVHREGKAKAREPAKKRKRSMAVFPKLPKVKPAKKPAKKPRFSDTPEYREYKARLYEKQGGACIGCQLGLPMRNLTIDHIVPRSKGGTDEYENLQLLCNACNVLKGNKSQETFLEILGKVLPQTE